MQNLSLKNGNRIPVLGLGTWELTGKKCQEAVKKALELGYRHIDTAEAYGNQREIGEAIKDFDRDELFITSKVWREHLHFDDAFKACDETLKDLKTEYLDLYLIHWPNRSVPLTETFEALGKLVEMGKVKSVGVSNFTIHHLQDALEFADMLVNVNQVEFHPHLYQKDLLEFCKKNKIVLTAYSPIGRGNLINDQIIVKIAHEYQKTPAQICLRWGLEKGCVVIPKASSENHLRENMGIFDWKLEKEDAEKIDLLGEEMRIVERSFSDFDY